VTEQQDANATVTELSEFTRCPRRYYLGHYLGFDGRSRRVAERGEDESLPASDLGTQVHQLLAGAAVPEPDDEALRLADNFRSSALGRRAAKATRVEREFDFLMAVDDLVIRGQVDLWFEEGAELVIVDYKTDAVNLAEAHRRARDYGLQLRLYAMAVEQLAGRAADRAFLYFARPNVTVEIDLAPSLIESPSEVVREFQEAQSSLQFPLNEGERCHRCPFFHDLCPAMGG
jgi:CRISPR/Cas system-associated exonuclease Cas4 (RecB family)